MVDLSLIKPVDLWYIVGLITTDGNLCIDGRHINITSKDKHFLVNVKNALLLSNKITYKSRSHEKLKKYSFLQFADVSFYKFLLGIGLTPKKSLTIKKIKVPKPYFEDFLRGVIDGDGNINKWVHKSNGNLQWALRIFSGSCAFVTWLKNSIKNNFQVNGKLYEQTREGGFKLYTLKFGKIPTKIILNKCYYSSDCLALKRKYLLALECLQDKNKLSKYGNVVCT